MNIAVVEFNNNQYKVEEGKTLNLPSFDYDEKKKNIEFDKVLLVEIDGKTEIGSPYVDKAKVVGEVAKKIRSEKVRVFKFKSKKRYKRTYGQRQDYITVKIDKISK